ncbi:MAG: hypothetical protein ACP6IP_00650 [Candidatus Njordarchaeia archaeon]
MINLSLAFLSAFKLMQIDQETYYSISIIIYLVLLVVLVFNLIMLYLIIQEIKRVREVLEKI